MSTGEQTDEDCFFTGEAGRGVQAVRCALPTGFSPEYHQVGAVASDSLATAKVATDLVDLEAS